jgi:hypothetical protein
MTPRTAGCLWVHVGVLLRRGAGHRVAGPCLDAACGRRAVRRLGFRKNHRDEPAGRSLRLTEAPGPDAARLSLAGPPLYRPTKAVSRMPRGTTRGSIVVEAPEPAPVHSKPWGLDSPPLPARSWPNPPQPVQVRPAWPRVLAVLPSRLRGAQPSAMPATTMAWPRVWGTEPRWPSRSRPPADPPTPESDPPSPGRDSPGRLP